MTRTTKTNHGWRSRAGAVGLVIALAAVPAAAATVAVPAVTDSAMCGGYHGLFISAGGCGPAGYGYAPPPPPPPIAPPPPPPPGDFCRSYQGPFVSVHGWGC